MVLRSKDQRQWSPYKRLLLMMSICDIMFSMTIGAAAFLRPEESSKRLWAFGTEATCSAVGFFHQLSTSAIWYNGSLSTYFLLTTRFGMKNADVSRCFEPVMHAVSIGFPLLTAIFGSVIGLWGEMPVNGFRCYMVDLPKNCGSQPGHSREECISDRLFIMFYYVPVILTFVALVGNNTIISHFVWKQTNPKAVRQRATSSAGGSSGGNHSYPSAGDSSTNSELDTSGRHSKSTRTSKQGSTERRKQQTERQKEQRQRLRLIRSQAFLFVACYTTSYIWPFVINQLKKGAKSDEELMDLLCKYYPLMICEAMLLPLQGMFNLFVFIRPKWLRSRHDFPKENLRWALRRSVFGAEIKPTQRKKESSRCASKNSSTGKCKVKFTDPSQTEDYSGSFAVSSVAKPLSSAVSSLSGSGLEQSDDEGPPITTPLKAKKKKWFKPRNRKLTEGRNKALGGSLQVISELSVSQFQSITDMDDDAFRMIDDDHSEIDDSDHDEDDDDVNTRNSEPENSELQDSPDLSSRWSAHMSQGSSARGHWSASPRHQVELAMPRRMSSNHDNMMVGDINSSSESDGSDWGGDDSSSEGSSIASNLVQSPLSPVERSPDAPIRKPVRRMSPVPFRNKWSA
ncbi:unnamed protein product [Cylindrotheca closterium]|uniref:Uncharacterized protein n=1 Tax=Cylindrotheca closterium TaxID=2856 RepID=A0AAD2FT17_9STRA|nr:unnamed protein product [Cylindrotheca closterium]